ncbi:molybdopterin-binding protein [Phenylobacterium sp.]|uniref:molybdopterin-binding protein n=1 Tax=Phenylobacterium sp. TaxID=1871053 RepID=UPI00272F1B06|nr:molybdopterin-binding protein [Phenylobacterium sp.]MDP1872691.1 molybdopterin-binding protein [Phenylobacterium sp.]MDP3490793.1 molybdopterin-binding protein [Phenylobacterium sp.]
MTSIPRRGLLAGAGSALLGLTLAGCDQITRNPSIRATLAEAEGLTKAAQRLILSPTALAREFAPADISPDFRANGSLRPAGVAYRDLAAGQFADWRLQIGGLVDRPLSLSLDDLRARPARTQITRHDCVEGWSSIGQWTGARLSALLEAAGLQPQARFIVFHCADRLDTFAKGDRGLYYESIDLVDAFHEQTILAYEMNGQVLPVKHGAPLRLRVERQLGYKHAKYVMRIEAVESFAHIAGGQGGFWEDRGYEWYAGI